MYGNPRPALRRVRAGVYAPTASPHFRVDVESSKQVWSSEEGYPGDGGRTGTFYRDIGFDLEYDYIKPYIHPDGIRCFYRHQVPPHHRQVVVQGNTTTGIGRWKRPASHAGNFMFNREKQVEHLRGVMQA